MSEVLNMEISLFYADEKFISNGTINIIAQAYFPCLIKDWQKYDLCLQIIWRNILSSDNLSSGYHISMIVFVFGIVLCDVREAQIFLPHFTYYTDYFSPLWLITIQSCGRFWIYCVIHTFMTYRNLWYAKVGDKIDLWLQLKILTYCRPSVWEKWQSAWQIDGDYGEKSIILRDF